MKKHLKFLVIAVFAAFVSSCNKDSQEVKLIPVKSGEEFQYIDKEGKIVINPQFSAASVFRNGIALVKPSGKDAKWGFIDEKGSYVINPQYISATVFSEGLAWVVTENGAPTAINEKGEIKITLQNAEEVRVFSGGFAAFSTTDKSGNVKWGFVDTKGNVKINPQFAKVGCFSDGKCNVANEEGKWGYIDASGKISINYQFKLAQSFYGGRAIVSNNDKYGVIGIDGKYIVNPQFKCMIADGEWFSIYQNEKWGWCDKNGKIIINPQFANVGLFLNKQLAPVQFGDNWGYVNKEGKIIINPQFRAALSFNSNLALVVSSDKIGFINEEGRFIINPQFDSVSEDYVLYVNSEFVEVPEDYIMHFNGGGTIYGSVQTDFFDIEAITNTLKLTNPEGFNFNSTFGDIMKKLILTESDFYQYSNEHIVIKDRKITNDVSFDFVVYGSAYDEVNVMNGSGWYAYNTTEYKFKPSKKIVSFGYLISLTGKGYGKSKSLISSFVSKLNGFKKGKYYASGNMYFNKEMKIVLIGDSNQVIIQVLPIEGTEVIDTDLEIVVTDFGDYEPTEPATDSVVVVDTVAVDYAY
jgi:hypothetical protein